MSSVAGDAGTSVAAPPVAPAKGAHRRRRRVFRRVVAVAVVAGCLLGGGLAVPARQAWQAHDHLRQAGRLMLQLKDQLRQDDPAGARGTLAALRVHTAGARARTDGLAWRIGGRLPAVGVDVTAVRTVAAALDDLARIALPPLVDLAGSLDPADFMPKDGGIDVSPLREAAPRLAAADTVVRQVRDRVDAIPAGRLYPELRAAVTQLRDGLDRVAGLTATAARSSALLASVLGAGPRTFLVLFQNLAEVRASGGMPGAFVVVRVEQGRVQIVKQGTATTDLETFPSPVLPLDPMARSLYTDRLGSLPADINFTPHFPTTAALAREMYRRRFGVAVDGVFATDPVALAYLLAATGPVRPPGGPALSADNAVRVLLSEVYNRYSTEDQDRYFAGAARTVFDVLSRGAVDVPAAVGALATAAGEHRLLFWSADPAEQALIAGTVLEGALPAADDARPTVGVFLNNGGEDKLSYYLTHSARLEPGGCTPDRRRELRLTVTLGSTAPRSGLSPVMLDTRRADPYTMLVQVLVFSPAPGRVLRARVDGRETPLGAGVERGRAVGVLFIGIEPGASRTVEVTLMTGPLPDAAIAPRLRTTPGVTPWAVSIGPTSRCS